MHSGPTTKSFLFHSSVPWALVALVGALGCNGKDDGDASSTGTTVITPTGNDADADGYDDSEDCDDNDASVFPGAPEACNGVDDDCDGDIDEDATDMVVWYADADADGFTSADDTISACEAPSGYASASELDDCNDDDADTNPDADETCDGADNDCDGDIDEDAIDQSTWYTDADGDGYGDVNTETLACEAAADQVDNGDDCDDGNDAISPDADEVCDTVDNDCDSDIDEDAIDALTWYADTDADTYGDADSVLVECTQPGGYVDNMDDCNDDESSAYPGAPEICDELDNDCDTVVDGPTSTDATTWYADADMDGFGDATVSVVECEQPSGYVADDNDCDDGDINVNPDAIEACNTIDDDCDGSVDEAGATGSSDFYADTDTDSYGDPDSSISACSAPSGYVADNTDCDDGDTDVNPGETEVCDDGIDNDCDGTPNTCQLSGTYSPSDAAAILQGPTESASGAALAFAGDIDGDGAEDIIIGAYGYDHSTVDDGGAFLVSGPLSGTIDLSTGSDAIIEGENRGDFAGYTVAGIGDADNDGFDDIIVGANGFETSTAVRNHGAVYLLHGPLSGTIDLATADARVDGDALTDFLGFASAGIGDVDNDGTADFAAAAYAEDTNGTSAGAVYIFAGTISGGISASTASATILGDNAGDELGISVGGGGDMDGDGVADLAIGARYNDDSGSSNSGSVYVFTSSPSGALTASDADLQITGAAASDQNGWAVALHGDFDNDGYDDLVTSAVGADSSTGAIYVFSGPLTGIVSASTADATLTGEATSDQAGRSIANGSDLNGDGFDDLVIGAYGNDTGGNNAGAVYAVHGPLSGSIGLASADAVFVGNGTGQTAGTAVAAGGDLDGDGLEDALIGAPGDDTASSNAGATWLWAGFGL